MSDQGRRVGAAIFNTSQCVKLGVTRRWCRFEAPSAQMSALKFCTTVAKTTETKVPEFVGAAAGMYQWDN